MDKLVWYNWKQCCFFVKMLCFFKKTIWNLKAWEFGNDKNPYQNLRCKKNAAKTAVACGYLLLRALFAIKAIRNQRSGLSSPLRPTKFRKSDGHKKRRSLLRRLYLLVGLFVCSLFACLLVCLFARSVLCLCVCVPVCLSVRLSPRSFVCLFHNVYLQSEVGRAKLSQVVR